MSTSIQSAKYFSNDPVQGSFGIRTHQNVSVSDISNNSLPLESDVIIISSVDYYKMEVNAPANISSVILPPGFTVLILNTDDILNFIKVGSNDFELSIIDTL